MNYIKAWQSLPEYGISLFIVRFTGKSKDELLGIANNRLMRMDLHSGDHLKTWRYNTMKVRVRLHIFCISLRALIDFYSRIFLILFADILGRNLNKLNKRYISECKRWECIILFFLQAWNVNWEVKHMMVQFEEENIIFECQSADCKVVHEFIGGYIFLSMRSKEANQTLNEEMFHKLTGGWV